VRAGAPVRLDRVADFSGADRDAARALSAAVYPPAQFADAPGRKREWAAPEWAVRLYGDDGALLSYVGIWLRGGAHDGAPVRIGGIGSVKTHPAARKRGLAALGMARAADFFRAQGDVAFALLVCDPRLLEYYGSLGWRAFSGRLHVTQRGVPETFTFNRVMTLAVNSSAPATGDIDLLGPPW
jgi:GNAT superfamily N-acetyltransferase